MYYAIVDPYASETANGFANTKQIVCFNSRADREKYCLQYFGNPCTRRDAEKQIASNRRRERARQGGWGTDENFGSTELPAVPLVLTQDGWVPKH